MDFRHLLSLALLLLSSGAWGATPVELDGLMKSGQPVTVIDLRSTEQYQRGHIAGAINIPSWLVGEKRMPPLGRVVVYCDGLGSTYAGECVAALNGKAGIQAEALEGGYAAWETFTNVTAEAVRITKQTPVTITYEQLQATQGQNVVLIDARRDPAAVAKASGEAPRAKINLGSFRQQTLPRAALTADAAGQVAKLKGKKAKFEGAPALLVVIDNDNASAMAAAERIQQAGYKRVVVLAGGEEIIRRGGRAGLARQGAAAPITLEPALKPQPLAGQGQGQGQTGAGPNNP